MYVSYICMYIYSRFDTCRFPSSVSKTLIHKPLMLNWLRNSQDLTSGCFSFIPSTYEHTACMYVLYNDTSRHLDFQGLSPNAGKASHTTHRSQFSVVKITIPRIAQSEVFCEEFSVVIETKRTIKPCFKCTP